MDSKNEVARQKALWRITSYGYDRWSDYDKSLSGDLGEDIKRFRRILKEIEFRLQIATRMSLSDIQFLRDIENGMIVYDPDDSYAGFRAFTKIDHDDRLRLSDGGLTLLFAIDCDFDRLRCELECVIDCTIKERPVRELAKKKRQAEEVRQWQEMKRARERLKKQEAFTALRPSLFDIG